MTNEKNILATVIRSLIIFIVIVGCLFMPNLLQIVSAQDIAPAMNPEDDGKVSVEGEGQFGGAESKVDDQRIGDAAASVYSHLMCEGVDGNFNPINPTTVFSPGYKKIYLWTKFYATSGQVVKSMWYRRSDSSKNWDYLGKSEGTIPSTGTWVYAVSAERTWEYPRAFRVRFYLDGAYKYSEYFEVTDGGWTNPNANVMCTDIDGDGNPVDVKNTFTIGQDSRVYHYTRFDKAAYHREDTDQTGDHVPRCHRIRRVWYKPDGSVYQDGWVYWGDYKDAGLIYDYWSWIYDNLDYMDITSSTPTGTWRVDSYLETYLWDSQTKWYSQKIGDTKRDPFLTITFEVKAQQQHTVTITSVTANPTTVNSGDVVTLNAQANCNQGHSINYSWAVNPSGGSFDNPNKQSPKWTAPSVIQATTYTFTVTAKCSVDSNVKDTDTVQVTVLPISEATIEPVVASCTQSAGDNFTVEIKVEKVTNLFGIAFQFHYTNTTNFNVLSAEKGDFLGNDVIFWHQIEPGVVYITNTRKGAVPGVNGDGIVARITMNSEPNTPEGEKSVLTITDIDANDPSDIPIGFTVEALACPGGAIEIIVSGICVWPGDTNDNGTVDQADVLPIGLHWHATGPARPNPGCAWDCQPVDAWSPEQAAYADANGDGTVDQADILCIGLNWHKTHTGSPAAPSLPISNAHTPLIMPVTTSATQAGSTFTVDIKVDKASNLFGVAFALQYTNPRGVNVLSVDKGDFLGDDVLFYPHIDAENGIVNIGISRKHPDIGVNGSGVVAKVRFQSHADATSLTVTNLTVKEVTANNPSGDSILFEMPVLPNHASVVVHPMPKTSQLLQNFPNPFNPETWIPFKLSSPADVKIRIYNVSGKLVRTIDLGHKPGGVYISRDMAAYWDGKNSNGEVVSSGIYIYTIQAGKFSATKKMIVVR